MSSPPNKKSRTTPLSSRNKNDDASFARRRTNPTSNPPPAVPPLAGPSPINPQVAQPFFVRPIMPPWQGGDARRSENRHLTLTASEHEYVRALPARERQRVCKVLETFERARKVPRRVQVLCSSLPTHVKEEMFRALGAAHAPSAKYLDWVDKALALPINSYTPRPKGSAMDFLRNARAKMNMEITGHHNAKNEVMRQLCAWVNTGCASIAIGLEGEPGIGKTVFAKRVLANCMGRPFCFLSLGGNTDVSGLLGHSSTYEGAIPGDLALALTRCGRMDPVIFFDELDKLCPIKGAATANALVHITDPVQNGHIHDRFFQGIDLDLSRAVFVFSYNDASRISPILLDRLKRIRMESPSVEDKRQICREHIFPRVMADAGISHAVGDDVIDLLLARNKEPGMRGIERDIKHIVQSHALVRQCGPAVIGLSENTCADALTSDLAQTLLADASSTDLSASSAPPSVMYS